MADILTEAGRIVKMEVDYASTCDEKIPECEKLAKSGQLNEAIEALLSLEKQTRTVNKFSFINLAEPRHLL
jgi:26S proteasome regulatory subunit N5